MALTLSNVATLNVLNILNKTNEGQQTTMERLSTGFKINAGKDNPAGLIALNTLDSDLNVTNVGLAAAQRADSILGIADSALGEITGLLGEVEKLAAAATSSGGLSDAEIAANQSQIDAAIESIDRIVRQTNFEGKRLLDGTQAISRSGVDDTKVTDLRVYTRRSASTSQSLDVSVQTAATKAEVAVASAVASQDTVLAVHGTKGVATINVGSGQTLSAVATNISATAAETGVEARVSGGTLYATSVQYGDNEFVTVERISGSTNYADATDTGSDAVVTVNGQSAAVDGLKVAVNQNGLSITFNMTTSFNVAASSESFTITTGGATFQLGTDAASRSTIGIDAIASFRLGDSLNGYLSDIKAGGSSDLKTDASKATLIAKSAKASIAEIRGRIGGFQKFQVQPAINALTANQESLTKVREVIGAADYATEVAQLQRQQAMMQSGLKMLGLASQQAAQVLALL